MRSSKHCIVGVAILALLAFSAAGMLSAGDKGKGKKAATMKPGDKAPKFESIDDQGKPFKSTDIVGKVVVLFFYPAALTGG